MIVQSKDWMLAPMNADPPTVGGAARTSRGARLGRAGRLQAREHVPSPVRPGLSGGQYRPLSDADLARIHATALRVLAEIGMAEATPEIIEIALPNGCIL